MNAAGIPDLKRIEFFPGQRLTAADLTDVQDSSRELRWLHNRSLHGWGIGLGYAVTGEAGDTAVTVGTGYAIDCMGRELILTSPVTISVPSVAGVSNGGKTDPAQYFLTITYLDDDGQATEESRPGVCLPSGTVRLTEGPLVEWRQFKDIQEGANVILAEASILNCQLHAPLGLDVRRNARPADQPFINAGQVSPAAVSWTVVAGGIAALVDTTAAKFSTTPAYFAHVMGPRQVLLPGKTFSLVTIPIVQNPAPSGFVMQVVVLMFNTAGAVVAVEASDLSALIPNLAWTIVWMGIER